MRGIQGSGKSTYAKKRAQDPNWKRVCRDDLRLMFDNIHFNAKNEKFISKVEKEMILSILDSGKNAIIDSMNLSMEKIKERKAVIKGYYPAVEFEIKSFLDVPLEKCIENDLKRENSLGASIIQNTWMRHFDVRENKKHQADPRDGNLNQLYIFDLDGSLAQMNGRKPFMWDRVGEDKLRVDVALILRLLHRTGNTIYIMSGRDSSCRELTEKWLDDYIIPYEGLYMRAKGDSRKDAIIKRELFDQHVARKGFVVCGVFDDRPIMVREWKSMGLTVFNIDDRIYHTEF
jgi:predicted kinase